MTKQYRTCLSAWIILGTIGNMPWLIVWLDWGHGKVLEEVAFAAIVSGLVVAWLASFRITITPTELYYRNLFGTRSIRHDQIKKMRWVWVRTNKGHARQLIVEPRPDSGAKEMSINAKVFSKAAVIAVLDLGKRVAESDDGGLLDGIVVKTKNEKNERQ